MVKITPEGGKEEAFEFPMEEPKGVYEFFCWYPHITSAAYDRGDMNALMMIVDFEEALNHVKFTKRQKEAMVLVFVEGKSQRQAGEIMNVTQQAIQRFLFLATGKIAKQYAHKRRKTDSRTVTL